MALPAGQDFNDVPRCLLIWPVVRSNTTCSTCNTVVLYSANNSNEIKIRCFSIVFTVLKLVITYFTQALGYYFQCRSFVSRFLCWLSKQKEIEFCGPDKHLQAMLSSLSLLFVRLEWTVQLLDKSPHAVQV